MRIEDGFNERGAQFDWFLLRFFWTEVANKLTFRLVFKSPAASGCLAEVVAILIPF